MPVRPFRDTLNALRFGAAHDELSDELNRLVQACAETGRAGTLTLRLTIKPGKAGQMEIGDDVTAKIPKLSKGTSLMFATPEGNLQREDPRQLPLAGLRTVDTTTGEVRHAAGS